MNKQTETLYKVLARRDDKLVSCNGGEQAWQLGEWVEVQGELVPCVHGIHLCREGDLTRWLGEVIAIAEYDGERIDCEDKVVVQRARITSVCETWNERTQRLFAVDCARIAVNRHAPEGQRDLLHAVLDVTVAREEWAPDREYWSAAWSAARSAARSAAESAARSAAESAARSAARSAAWSAAESAARSAAESAAWSAARSAAWSAAESAAESAAWSAAWSAARSAAWAEQTALLMRYLAGGEGPFIEEES